MTTQWTEPALVVHERQGVHVADDGLTASEVLHIERVAAAWRLYWRTGDRWPLVNLGILPQEEV